MPDTSSRREMKIGAFLLATGHHQAGWRAKDAAANGGADIAHYIALAQACEAAKLDMVFLEDVLSVRDTDPEIVSRMARAMIFEPTTLLAALAVSTERIGLVGTASTSYHEPYNVARSFGSLDLISRGRAGWNQVTSITDLEARNFGRDQHFGHAERYVRAEEFAKIVRGLWQSWSPAALCYDKQAGRFFEPDGMRVLNHEGQFFRVRGPLNVAPSPQGHPVIVQAGSSDAGQRLAAQSAEVVFTAQTNLADAQAFYRGLKTRLAGFGRNPSQLHVLPGISAVVGQTREEARQKFEALQELVDFRVALRIVAEKLDIDDLASYPLDGPVPPLPDTQRAIGRQNLLRDLAEREGLTIRELCMRVAGARGHLQLVGSVTEIADVMEEWFLAKGCDGFNIMPAVLPTGLTDFLTLVIPELQRRGLFRTEYRGTTLRAHLELDIPLHEKPAA